MVTFQPCLALRSSDGNLGSLSPTHPPLARAPRGRAAKVQGSRLPGRAAFAEGQVCRPLAAPRGTCAPTAERPCAGLQACAKMCRMRTDTCPVRVLLLLKRQAAAPRVRFNVQDSRGAPAMKVGCHFRRKGRAHQGGRVGWRASLRPRRLSAVTRRRHADVRPGHDWDSVSPWHNMTLYCAKLSVIHRVKTSFKSCIGEKGGAFFSEKVGLRVLLVALGAPAHPRGEMPGPAGPLCLPRAREDLAARCAARRLSKTHSRVCLEADLWEISILGGAGTSPR